MTPQDRIRKANEAAGILESQVYKEAYERFLGDIERLRLSIGPRDTEGAHRLVLMEQAVKKARYLMDKYIKDGDQAVKELEALQNPSFMTRATRKFRQVV